MTANGYRHVCLQVNPITIVASDPFFEMRQRITVNNDFICYSLKTCQIRALHKRTGRRALLKDATAPPDIRYAQAGLQQVDQLVASPEQS